MNEAINPPSRFEVGDTAIPKTGSFKGKEGTVIDKMLSSPPYEWIYALKFIRAEHMYLEHELQTPNKPALAALQSVRKVIHSQWLIVQTLDTLSNDQIRSLRLALERVEQEAVMLIESLESELIVIPEGSKVTLLPKGDYLITLTGMQFASLRVRADGQVRTFVNERVDQETEKAVKDFVEQAKANGRVVETE